jgi:formate dehydrogenase gamma subunit
MEEKVTRTEGKTDRGTEMSAGSIWFVRLNYHERLQHIILAACIIILVITGFMLHVPEDSLLFLGTAGEMVFFWRSVLHRWAGTVMILVSLYHVYYIIFTPAGRRWITDMMMKPKDVKELAGSLQYYVGLKDSPPEYDRFCYKHKFEYFALFFGNTVMSVTGLLMWTEQYWSKFILDISALMHGMEAILATLAIIIWHMYEVHLRPHKFPGDTMWLHGLIDEEEMKEEYPLHYKKIMEDPELQKIYIKRSDNE